MSIDFMLGLAAGLFGAFGLDHAIFPRLAHTLARRQRRLFRGR